MREKEETGEKTGKITRRRTTGEWGLKRAGGEYVNVAGEKVSKNKVQGKEGAKKYTLTEQQQPSPTTTRLAWGPRPEASLLLKIFLCVTDPISRTHGI